MKKRKDGRLCRTITDPRTKRRVYFYGSTEREINRKMMEYTVKAEKGRTFEEVAKEWWREHEESLEIQSVKTYRPALKRAIEEFGSQPIKDITPKDISRFLRDMLKLGFSQKTISNQRMIVSLVFRHAVLQNDIAYNSCQSVTVPKGAKKTERPPATAQEEEIIRKSAQIWIVPFIALCTGMRKGEILALKWDDIDFDKDYIYVERSVAHNSDTPFLKGTKTESGVRYVPLLPMLKEELLKMHPRNKGDYIATQRNTPMAKTEYQRKYEKYKKQTGTSCTLHQLRHSFASIAFECGVPLKSMQGVLGHSQISTTANIYTHFRKKAMEDVINLLQKHDETDEK